MLDLMFDDLGLEAVIKRFQPDFIGISIRNIDDVRVSDTKVFLPDYQECVSRIKSVTNVPVILGGSGFSIFPQQILRLTGADFGITGEAEIGIVHLLELLSGDPSPGPELLINIAGLVFREADTIVVNPKVNIDLKTICRPLIEEKILKNYLRKSSMACVQTQRGCPYSCIYCSYPLIEGCKVRFRDPVEIVEDFDRAIELGARYIYIVDSVFNISEDHITGVCNQLLRRNVRVEWGCFLRPAAISSESMKLMARAGLKHIEFGSDSFCDEVLTEYGKKFTFEDILSSSELARKENVHYAHFLILGGPGETESTMHISFCNSGYLKQTVIYPFLGMRLFPGTDLHRRAIREKVVREDQSLLEPTFYLSPEISVEKAELLLRNFQNQSPRWIFEQRIPQQQAVIERLRARGATGPLWEFLAE